MELQELEKLLKKYEAAETSLQEEQKLRAYFNTERVPTAFAPYKAIFAYTGDARKLEFNGKAKEASGKKFYVWSGIAATIILAVGLFFFQANGGNNPSNGDLGTVQDKDLAMEKTIETLEMVSEIMQDGRKDLVYLKEFNNTKNKFIKDQKNH